MTARIHRRSFLALVGTSAAAWPLAAKAQQGAIPTTIGYLYSGLPEATGAILADAFRKGLAETGFVEGRNLKIEYRFARNETSRLPELAAELVRARVNAIATPGGATAILAAKAATTTIPVVFGTGADPVQTGLVASLNRPGGNLTGFSSLAVDLGAKQLGLMHELLPGARRFGVLINNTAVTAESYAQEMKTAAVAVGRDIEILSAANTRELDLAFANFAKRGVEALVIAPSPLVGNRTVQLTALAAYYRLPSIFPGREAPEAGGLMSYGSNLRDMARQMGVYTGRILKGEKPADLPVQLATKIEYVVNLQTARMFGIELLPTLLALADEVIE